MRYRILFFSFLVFYLCSIEACDDNPFTQGEILYTNFCANCHMENGQGLKGLIPPLANADYLKDNPSKIACIIRKGMDTPVKVNGKTYEQPMLGIPQLTDFEIANVINYINQAWGNDLGFITIQEVRSNLEACKANK